MNLIDFSSYINFTAIDFETANASLTSICQIGLVRVENGEIIHEWEQLVQPPGNEYHWGNSRVHGINRRMTASAPTFNEVWHLMQPYVQGQHLVAHNANFDCSCLTNTLAHYQLPVVTFKRHCTVQIYKRNLAALCEEHHISLQHHNALSDARACALLFIKHLQKSLDKKLN